jgi:ankyrin repeat protein
VRELAADNPNQTDEQDRTGMHYAAMNGNLQIIAILIKAGADIDPRDRLGNTPLMLAAQRNQTEAADLLIEAGAKLNMQNRDGLTPLMIAAGRGNIALVRALLDSGADPHKTDFTGRDAIGWAQESHRQGVVEAIRQALHGHRS